MMICLMLFFDCSFRSGYSCETSIITTINDCLQEHDKGQQVDIAILDFVVWFLVLALGALRILLISGLVYCLALMVLIGLCLLIVFLGPFDQ
jgi:type IV secretory pathway TrbL component